MIQLATALRDTGYDPPEAARRLGYQPSGIYKTIERCLAALASGMTKAGLMVRRRPDR